MLAVPTLNRPVLSLWQELRQEADALALQEPVLAALLERHILMPDTPAHSLAGLLASRLHSADLPEDVCRALFLELLVQNPSILQAMAQDVGAIVASDPACRTSAHAYLNYKGFHAVQSHRLAHQLWQQGRDQLALWLSNRTSAVLGPDIHPAAQLGVGVMLDHGSGIVIGETAVVEDGVTILQNVTLGGTGKIEGDRHPKVRRGAMIGAGANVIGNIEIGAYSKVGAGSVVLKDVPAGCTMAGAPAQIVRIRQIDDRHRALQQRTH